MSNRALIPDNDAFNSFLGNCRVASTLEGDSVPLSGGIPRRDSEGQIPPGLYLQYPSTGMSLKAAVQKVRSALAIRGHIEDDRVALSAIALCVVTIPAGKSPAQHASEFLQSTCPAQLFQSIILMGQPGQGYVADLGTYSIRTFNPAKILYWASRCNSTYPQDLNLLRGFGAVEREPYEVLLLDCQGAQWSSSLTGNPDVKDLLDDYYNACARAYSNRVMLKVKQDLLVLEAGALAWIDDGLLDSLFQQTASLFMWKSNEKYCGWATYSAVEGINANFPPSGLMEDCRTWLTDKLGFNALSDTKPFDQTIKAYCRFMQRANRHRLEARPDEAFLHFIIALDLLFGASAGSSAETVASCTALLTFRQLRKDIDKGKQDVKALYGHRSRYVHDGKSVPQVALVDIEEICNQVLWTLLSASAANIVTDQEDWINRLRLILSLLDARREVADSELAAVGIPPPGTTRNPPNHVGVKFGRSSEVYL